MSNTIHWQAAGVCEVTRITVGYSNMADAIGPWGNEFNPGKVKHDITVDSHGTKVMDPGRITGCNGRQPCKSIPTATPVFITSKI